MTADQQREILEIMTRSRRFQQAAIRSYGHGDQGGFLMLDIGQDSIAACVRTLMGENDHSVCNQRGIGMAVASGIPFRSRQSFMGSRLAVRGGKVEHYLSSVRRIIIGAVMPWLALRCLFLQDSHLL